MGTGAEKGLTPTTGGGADDLGGHANVIDDGLLYERDKKVSSLAVNLFLNTIAEVVEDKSALASIHYPGPISLLPRFPPTYPCRYIR